jgi:hypothetical protein
MNRRKVPTLMGGVMLAESAAFALGSLLHIALKIGPLDEPKIVPAMIVEGLCAIVLLTGGVAVLRSTWNAWEMAISAQVFASLGVTLGIVALAASRGPRTGLNDAFHYTVLPAMVIGVITLWRREDRWRNQPDNRNVHTHDATPKI